MHHAEGATLLGRTVVRQEHHDGVVQLSHGAQSIDQPADLVIRVIQKSRERFLQATRQQLVRFRHVVPCRNAGVARSELGAPGNDTELELALIPAFTYHIPALVIAPSILLEVRGRGLMRGMGRTKGDVGEERTVGTDALAVVDHLQQLIDEVLGDVVAVVGARGRINVAVVSNQFGVELVGFSLQETVVAVEAPGERPLIERAGSRDVLGGGQMPLADTEGGIALGVKDLSDRGRRVRDVPQLMRKSRPPIRHTTHPHRVLRAPRQ